MYVVRTTRQQFVAVRCITSDVTHGKHDFATTSNSERYFTTAAFSSS